MRLEKWLEKLKIYQSLSIATLPFTTISSRLSAICMFLQNLFISFILLTFSSLYLKF